MSKRSKQNALDLYLDDVLALSAFAGAWTSQHKDDVVPAHAACSRGYDVSRLSKGAEIQQLGEHKT